VTDNHFHAHRHAYNALADFELFRQRRGFQGRDAELLHAISHHLRHVVWRTGQELPRHQRRYVRRRWGGL
jgi:hypothetical protein